MFVPNQYDPGGAGRNAPGGDDRMSNARYWLVALACAAFWLALPSGAVAQTSSASPSPKSPSLTVERVLGVWYYGDDCANARARFTLGRSEARYVDLQDPASNFANTVISISGDQGGLTFQFEDGRSEFRPLGPNRLREVFTRTGEPPQELELFRCSGRDRLDAFLIENDHQEVEALVARVAQPCRDGQEETCLGPIWAFADTNGDAALSVAEIARLVRRAGKWAARASDPDIATADGAGVHLAGLLAAPLVARLVIDNYDFDGDGKLTRTELMIGTSVAEIAQIFADDPTTAVAGRSRLRETLEGLIGTLLPGAAGAN
jgi:hypothetical protein